MNFKSLIAMMAIAGGSLVAAWEGEYEYYYWVDASVLYYMDPIYLQGWAR